MLRRDLCGVIARALGAPLLALSLCAPAWAAPAAAPADGASAAASDAPQKGTGATAAPKVLRYSFRVAETGFDPAQISDLYSRTVTESIFDAPLQFELLARPARVRPNTLTGMPEVSDDFRSFTFHVKPGIFFADDEAFGGRKRELVAADYVYSIKRHYDPRVKSPHLYVFEGLGLVGVNELRREALATKKPFDYDRVVEGLRTLDRYTFQIRLASPDPRFLLTMADVSWAGAVAREVVERYGDHIMEHPVGTGPYRLASWRRASRMVLEKNPGYREVFYDEHPNADDAQAQAAARSMNGKRIPQIDRVEIDIIEESQPRWLAFLNAEHDLIEELPQEYAPLAVPNGRLAPNLAKRQMAAVRYPRSDVTISYFNMDDATVGGYSPDKVALRRAISLAVDLDKEIRLVRRSQAIPAQSIVGPGTWGYTADFKSEMSEFDAAKARALLDMYGYVDRDGDGWRDMPDGSPLVLEYATQPDQQNRQLCEQWQKNMNAIGIRIVFKVAKWPENLKSATAGKLMMWGLGWSAEVPDSGAFLVLGYGGAKGQANKSRFDLPAFNAVYERQRTLPDGPERQALVDEAKRLMVAYMPYKAHTHRIFTDITQPWVMGYQHNVFIRSNWRYLDIDTAMRDRMSN